MISGVQRETVYVVILSVIGNGHCFPGLKLGLFPGNQTVQHIYIYISDVLTEVAIMTAEHLISYE